MNKSCFFKKYGLWIALGLFNLIFSPVRAQEIDADVSVDRSQISSTSLNYLDNLSEEIENYINEYNWVEASFGSVEKINTDISIILHSVDDSYNFTATLIIRSRRPIYNTVQETALFLFSDENWSFNYTPNRALVHDELEFDALTSVLDFYAYIILGYDFDSFEELGGTSSFLKARNIVSLARTVSAPGWTGSGRSGRNRARLVSDLLNPAYAGLRQAVYRYHRHGLDAFIENPEEGREQILRALREIQETKRITSDPLLFDIFFNTKYRELVSVFEGAEASLRLQALNLLADLDPAHLSEYRDLQ